MSKQLLKLKPEIQDKIAEWFYDIVLHDFNGIINLSLSTQPIDSNVDTEMLDKIIYDKFIKQKATPSRILAVYNPNGQHRTRNEKLSLLKNIYKKSDFTVNYIFWILFIDFYNLCRILYFSGFNNDSKDMSNNIILNYGGENLFATAARPLALGGTKKIKLERVMDKNTGGHISIILLFFRNYLYKTTGKSTKYIKKTKPYAHYHFKNDNIEIKKYIRQDKVDRLECVKIK
jgi:hypothetical protein